MAGICLNFLLFFFCSVRSINGIQNLTSMLQINSLGGSKCNRGMTFRIVMLRDIGVYDAVKQCNGPERSVCC